MIFSYERGLDMSQVDNLKAILRDFLQVGPVGCGLIVTQNGKDIFSDCIGFADADAKIPMKRDTIVRLFSNSKVFTNVALMTLFEKGKFLLNDPIEKYLPEFAKPKVGFFTNNGVFQTRPAKRSILVRDLMSMSSGLTYGSGIAGGAYSQTHILLGEAVEELEKNGGYTVREFTKRIAQVPLLFDPGSSWSYGYSHDVIGALIEVLSDMSFEEYLYEAIFRPLDIRDTSFFIEGEKRSRLARQYSPRDEKGEQKLCEDGDRIYERPHKFMGGGGGLLGTLGDLSRFANMLSMGGTLDDVRILGRKTIDLMRENHLSSIQLEAFRAAHDNGWEFLSGYGYGLGVRTMIDRPAAGSNGSIGEFGWAGAAGTWLLADPEEKLSVAYVQQVLPNPYEGYCHPRLRAGIYALIN
jgi:CubicO group peptidase (beta-lactamase class C family)